jgi:outer membrane protein assembly factor BamA
MSFVRPILPWTALVVLLAGSAPSAARAAEEGTIEPVEELEHVPDDEAAAPLPSEEPGQESAPEGAESGPMYVLEGIEVEGNHKTSDSTILFFVHLEEGQTFSPVDERLEKDRYTLLATGWFSDVSFSLEKGAEHGHVVLVIEVVERSTFVIRDLALGFTHVTPYGGISVADYNFLGRGMNLGGGVVVGDPHLGFDVRFTHPFIFHSRFSLGLRFTWLKGVDWLGFDDVVAVWEGASEPRSLARVETLRRGGTLSLGFDIIPQFSIGLRYRLEVVDATMPVAASHTRGGMTQPVDFGLLRGRSYLSIVSGVFEYDSRDDPFLPSRGFLIGLSAEISTPLFGSSYSFTKFTFDYDHFFELPWKHVMHVELCAGLIAGSAPFFERFYLGDYTDFIPDRVMGLAFDHRRSLDLFRTTIGAMRYEDIVASLELEYAIPLYRSGSGVYGVDFFFSFGLFTLSRARDLHVTGERRGDVSAFPLDLTANLGFRLDTVAGYFELSLANMMALVPLEGG